MLSQVGEFAFVLLLQGSQYALLDARAAQIVLAAFVFSMLIAPLVVRYNGTIARRLVPHYARLREIDLVSIRDEAGEEAYAVGKHLEELRLDSIGASVSAVRRGGIRGPQPGPETRLRAGDVLVLYGTPEALEEAEKILLDRRQN